MTFSGIAIAAIVLAVLAVSVAVAAAVLLCVGHRRLAERLLPAFLAVLVGGIMLSFAAVAESQEDLQGQAERTLNFVTAAERTELARTGHYTHSVLRLARLSHGLAAELKVDGAQVRVMRGPDIGTITVSTSLGTGTHAEATLDAAGRLVRVVAHRPAHSSGQGLVQTRARRHRS